MALLSTENINKFFTTECPERFEFNVRFLGCFVQDDSAVGDYNLSYAMIENIVKILNKHNVQTQVSFNTNMLNGIFVKFNGYVLAHAAKHGSVCEGWGDDLQALIEMLAKKWVAYATIHSEVENKIGENYDFKIIVDENNVIQIEKGILNNLSEE